MYSWAISTQDAINMMGSAQQWAHYGGGDYGKLVSVFEAADLLLEGGILNSNEYFKSFFTFVHVGRRCPL